MTEKLSSSLLLPCGVMLKNRIAKAALSENLARRDHNPHGGFVTLYKEWSNGGAGLLITGNVMVCREALGEYRNIVLDNNFREFKALREWARAGTENQTQLWMQLNHPGKQSPNFLSSEPVAPSAIPFPEPLIKRFNKPRALNEEEILNIIESFAIAASLAKKSGFTGVQIHGAHGYLVSQFLSPIHNQRKDRWGGSLENRFRFVDQIYKSLRKELGPDFPIGIKVNSSDFQKGGFSENESVEVMEELSKIGIDLIEISGGTMEARAMVGKIKKDSTRVREAYFLDFCVKVKNRVSKTPIMLTGGFRSYQGIEEALKTGSCDLIGLGRSLTLDPSLPHKIMNQIPSEVLVKPLTTGYRKLDRLVPLEITWYTQQIHRLAKGKKPNPNSSPSFRFFEL